MAKPNGEEQKKAVRALFKDYDAANAALAKAKADSEAAMARRSTIVRQLAEVGGMAFERNGRTLKVQSRQMKNEKGEPVGEPTYFFRGEKEVEAFKAD